jgi:hypothetical protein
MPFKPTLMNGMSSSLLAPIDDSIFHKQNVRAQNSANCDNLLAAFQKTDHFLPIALITQAVVAAVQAKLYLAPVQNNPFTKSDS